MSLCSILSISYYKNMVIFELTIVNIIYHTIKKLQNVKEFTFFLHLYVCQNCFWGVVWCIVDPRGKWSLQLAKASLKQKQNNNNKKTCLKKWHNFNCILHSSTADFQETKVVSSMKAFLYCLLKERTQSLLHAMKYQKFYTNASLLLLS